MLIAPFNGGTRPSAQTVTNNNPEANDIQSLVFNDDVSIYSRDNVPCIEAGRISCSEHMSSEHYVPSLHNSPFAKVAWATQNLHISIHHWQLRNLIASTYKNNSDQLFFVSGQSVICYNRKYGSCIQVFPSFSFGPRCISVADGWCAVGGPTDGSIAHGKLNDTIFDEMTSDTTPSRMQLMSYTNPSSLDSFSFQSHLGGSIVNNVHLYKSKLNNQINTIVSNNDRTVKIFNVESRNVTKEINFNIAMNFSIINHSQSMLASVGDSDRIFLHGINNTGEITPMTILNSSEFADSSFHVSFSSSELQIAVAHQRSSLSIWDVRNLKTPLHRIKTDRVQPFGAVRVCKFAPPSAGPLDLLMYSEGSSYVHIFDMRTLKPIAVLECARNREIAGVTWSETGQYVYVASEHNIVAWKIKKNSRKYFPSYSPI